MNSWTSKSKYIISRNEKKPGMESPFTIKILLRLERGIHVLRLKRLSKKAQLLTYFKVKD